MTLLRRGSTDTGAAQRSRTGAAGHAAEARLVGRSRWTPATVLLLIGGLAVVVASVTGVLLWGFAVGRDEAPSRLAVERYFAAIQDGEAVAGSAVSCSDEPLPFEEWGLPEVAEALSAASIAESGVEIGLHLDGDDGIRYHDFEVPRRARGTVVLQATEDSAQWRVCGLLSSVDLRVPD